MNVFDIMLNKLSSGKQDTFKTDELLDKIINDNNLGNYDSFFYFVNKAFSKFDKINNKKSKDNEISNELTKFLSELANDAKKNLNDRSTRYNEYYSMVKMISYAKRALQVTISEITAPNNVSKENFIIVGSSFDGTQKNTSEIEKANLMILMKQLKLKNYVKKAIRNSKWLGDGFIEIANADIELKKNDILLQENLSLDKKILETYEVEEGSSLKTTIEITEKLTNKSFLIESDNDNDKNKNNVSLDDLFLINHNPGTVVRLGDEVCLGYLIFPKNIKSSPSLSGDTLYSVNSDEKITEFLRKLKMQLQQKQHLVKDLEFNTDIRIMLAKLFLFNAKNNNLNNNSINANNNKIRFVPSEQMYHFKNESDQYAPYGESMFSNMEFDARLLVLLKSAIAIMRMSRAVEKRLISLEFGAQRSIRKIITRAKEEFERRKVALTSTGGLDSIPSLIPTYENIYLPMINGKKFIEFDTLPNIGDPNNAVEDLKAARDAFVGGLNVPPAYLGIEENLESKNTLTQQNVIFAKSIINDQEEFEVTINNMTDYIYYVVYGQHLLTTTLSFPRPKSIELELDKVFYESLNDFFDLINKLGLSIDIFKQKYLDPELSRKTLNDHIDIIKKSESSGGENAGGENDKFSI